MQLDLDKVGFRKYLRINMHLAATTAFSRLGIYLQEGLPY